MKIMNANEAKEFLKEKYSSIEGNSDILEFAVKNGMILKVPNYDLYSDLYYCNSWGRYKVDSIYRVPDEVIKEHELYYHYRRKSHMIHESEDFQKLDEIAKRNLRFADDALTEIVE